MKYKVRGTIVLMSADGKVWEVFTIARTPQRAREIVRELG